MIRDLVGDILSSLERACKEETDIVLTPEIAYELVRFLRRVLGKDRSGRKK